MRSCRDSSSSSSVLVFDQTERPDMPGRCIVQGSRCRGEGGAEFHIEFGADGVADSFESRSRFSSPTGYKAGRLKEAIPLFWKWAALLVKASVVRGSVAGTDQVHQTRFPRFLSDDHVTGVAIPAPGWSVVTGE